RTTTVPRSPAAGEQPVGRAARPTAVSRQGDQSTGDSAAESGRCTRAHRGGGACRQAEGKGRETALDRTSLARDRPAPDRCGYVAGRGVRRLRENRFAGERTAGAEWRCSTDLGRSRPSGGGIIRLPK